MTFVERYSFLDGFTTFFMAPHRALVKRLVALKSLQEFVVDVVEDGSRASIYDKCYDDHFIKTWGSMFSSQFDTFLATESLILGKPLFPKPENRLQYARLKAPSISVGTQTDQAFQLFEAPAKVMLPSEEAFCQNIVNEFLRSSTLPDEGKKSLNSQKSRQRISRTVGRKSQEQRTARPTPILDSSRRNRLSQEDLKPARWKTVSGEDIISCAPLQAEQASSLPLAVDSESTYTTDSTSMNGGSRFWHNLRQDRLVQILLMIIAFAMGSMAAHAWAEHIEISFR